MEAGEEGQLVFDGSHTVRPFTSVYRGRFAHGMANGNAPHFHPDTIEVCFVARGHLDWWIGDESLEVRSGDVVVVPAGLPHGSVDSTLQPCEFYAVHVAPEALSPTLARVANGPHGRIAGCPKLGEKVREVFEAHREGGPLMAELVPALAVILFATLDGANEMAGKKDGHALVREAKAILSDPDDADLGVDVVAGRLGVSSVWLTRLFRQDTGEAPGEWVRSRRLAEAKRMLALERSSITEIAVRLRYSSSQYFAWSFRRECGMTPTAYRALCAAQMPFRTASALCVPMR